MSIESVIAFVKLAGTPVSTPEVVTGLRITTRQAISALCHLHRTGRLMRVGRCRPYRYKLPDPPVTWRPLPPPQHPAPPPAEMTGPYYRL